MLKYILIFLCFSVKAFAQNNSFEIWGASDLENVFEDGYKFSPSVARIDLFGIRNEIVSAQFVIHTKSDLDNISIITGNLIDGNNVIISNELTYNFVKTVPLKENSDISSGNSLLRKAPASFPDYLAEDKSVSIKKDVYQPVWITIHIPKNAVAGTYKGTIKVTSAQGTESLPIAIIVYPLEMPETSHLKTTNWYSITKDHYDFTTKYDEKYFKLLEAFIHNMADHRQNVFRVDLDAVSPRIGKDNKLQFDFTNFDRCIKLFESTGRMNSIETGFIAEFVEDWFSPIIKLRDFKVLNAPGKVIEMKGEDYLPQFLPVFQKHLKEKGWLTKTLFHIADEPSNFNIISYRENSAYVHKYAPLLRRMDALEATFFDDRLEVWVPKLNELNDWWDVYKKAQHDGNELWYYMAMSTNGYPNRFIDSRLIETRILHWLNYRFNLTGYLHWGYNAWTGKDPYTQMGLPAHGVGSNAIVYPKKDGVINSIRWEEERNGLSDYEYLWLLEQEVAKLKKDIGAAGSWINPMQRGVELASKVIFSLTNFTRDPNVLYAAKKQILDEILDLKEHPKLYVQTFPFANSQLIYGPVLVEITGYAEPGSLVFVNDKDITQTNVTKEGVFRIAIEVTPENNKIKITAKKGALSKTIEREYSVAYPTDK